MTSAEERNEEAVEATSDVAPEEAADAAPTSSPDAPEGGGEPAVEEELTPKQRRKLRRSRADGPPGAQLSVEERAEARAERRRAAARARRRGRARQREKRGDERGEGTPAAEPRTVARKARVGTVVSDRAEKSITVRIETARRHPAYEKIVRRSNTLHAHDERNDARIGDLVKVVETRPVSRTKRWRLVEVVKRAR